MVVDEYDEKHVKIGGVSVVKETEKAFLVEAYGEQIWLPKSQMHQDSDDLAEGEIGTIIISKWIARQKELIA